MKSKSYEKRQNEYIYIICCMILNTVSFSLLSVVSRETPLIAGIGLMAYLLGIRHAFDADHIAAIDNTVRKLIEQHRDSNGVGFFFSLGHSTVVMIMSVLLGLFVHWSQQHLLLFQQIGHWIGSLVSSLFLISIAIVNMIIFFCLKRDYLKFKDKKEFNFENDERILNLRGPLTGIFHKLFKFINRSYHIYPIGFLFGLGFDTSTEVSLLALSAGISTHRISFTGILSIPLLFTSGMVIIDTLDSILMSKVYRQALGNPAHKFYYNMIVTSLSAAVALIIGVVELGQTFQNQFQWNNAFGLWLHNINMNLLGYGLPFLFSMIWFFYLGLCAVLRKNEKDSFSKS
ncbi:hypothetical protein EWI07_03130 [Sporolactobacillus sp. THM7-4]|nr:hypothetical protein EWI07_03130 [Sporolactobacillus sp. THM7-4]